MTLEEKTKLVHEIQNRSVRITNTAQKILETDDMEKFYTEILYQIYCDSGEIYNLVKDEADKMVEELTHDISDMLNIIAKKLIGSEDDSNWS